MVSVVMTPLIQEEFGLQCFGGYEICEMRSRGNGITNFMTYNRRTRVFQELKTVMRLVLEKHGLPLAMAWVPCSACNGLETVGVEYCARIDGIDLAEFSTVSKCSHLRKGWVASRALSLQSPDMLYFPSITKLSVDEYPLVPYARMCKFSGWFIMCLRSNYTGDDIYVLEFFWSTNSEDYENIQTRLKKLLGTMEDKLGNFRFASGLKLGQDSDPSTEQSSASVSNVYKIQATRTFSSQDSDPSTEQSSASVSNLRPWR
ncbi:hypothetical protein Vadar_002260 [Vaccinium darrowii]|uniref:Uncharacterized protein n=1 Tax=Vaccinium darrowii TaxID=229202 RepID=A0ACB7XES8_9ERIC|nr:hypothetical protein Vadar_002260 [Vaccinium darrowii]